MEKREKECERLKLEKKKIEREKKRRHYWELEKK